MQRSISVFLKQIVQCSNITEAQQPFRIFTKCRKIISEALEQTVEERMMEQRTITVQRISEKESDVFGWMKYLEE